MKIKYRLLKVSFLFALTVSAQNIFAQSSVLPLFQPSSQQRQDDALVLYNNGEYAAAIAVCEEELRQDPERVDAYVVLCWSLVSNKQYAEAEQRALDGLRVSPYDSRLTESLAEAYFYLGQNNSSLTYFQRFVANAPDSNARVGMAYYFMGELYIRQARYQHADIAFTAAVQKRPENDGWWVRLGYAREQAGNYYEAISAYDAALRLNPSSNDARIGRNRVSDHLR